MAAPALTVQAQGLGAVSADDLNTRVQWTSVATDLRAFTGVDGMQVSVAGTSAVDDGGAGTFFYDLASTAADDGANVIAPTGSMSGRWLRLALNSSGAIITGPQAPIASAATTDLGSAGSHLILVTGTATITSLGASASTSAPIYFVKFDDAATLTYNATSLILPGAASITTAHNDFAIVQYLGGGNWIVLAYLPASGGAPSFIASIPVTKAGVSTALAVSPAGLAAVEQSSSMTYADDTSGSPNTITLALVPTLLAYTEGMEVAFKLANTVTGTTALNIDGVGGVTLKIGGQNVVAGQLIANQIYTARYDGAFFQLTSPPNSGYFESATFALTSLPASGTFATGYSVPAKFCQLFIRCTSAELGYSVGDEVPIWIGNDSGSSHGGKAYISGTNVKYVLGPDAITTTTISSGVNANINNTKWVGFVRCGF